MADAVFRDLFVELPLAVFETLRAIGEQAIRVAAAPPVEPKWSQPRWQQTIEHPQFVAFLKEHFGWLVVHSHREAMRKGVRLLGKLACGHVHDVRIDEFELHITGNTVECLIAAIERSSRPCFCMRGDAP